MSTEKDLNYWKANAEEDYMKVPISVLRYITELETVVKNCSIPESMKAKYALVREFIYGWDWSEFSDDEGVIPVIYNTREEAQASLDEYIRDVNEAHDLGYIDEPYQNDMAIAEVKFIIQ